MNCVAIILARGGSKGIHQKNIVDFCGQPLITWTIRQIQQVRDVKSIWVSSDCDDILSISRRYGANTINRPEHLSDDLATSESAWLHAINYIEKKVEEIDLVLAPQVTSPLRTPADIDKGISEFIDKKLDSMFSCSIADDLFLWKRENGGQLKSVNYDYKNRQRRQDIPEQYIENGSFYLFKPSVLRESNNRLGGRIGYTKMEFWKLFEIDSLDDLKMCEALMKTFLL